MRGYQLAEGGGRALISRSRKEKNGVTLKRETTFDFPEKKPFLFGTTRLNNRNGVTLKRETTFDFPEKS